MKSIAVTSYQELESGIKGAGRAFLLLYKGGTEQSDGARERLEHIQGDDSLHLFMADVNSVRDIHERFEITTAPSLLVFEDGKMVNVIKGCQTQSAYDSLLSGREIGARAGREGEKSKQVTVYTTPTCSWCTTLKAYLDQKQRQRKAISAEIVDGERPSFSSRAATTGIPIATITSPSAMMMISP